VQRSLCQCPFLRAIHHLSEKNRHGPDTAGSVTRERNGQFEPCGALYDSFVNGGRITAKVFSQRLPNLSEPPALARPSIDSRDATAAHGSHVEYVRIEQWEVCNSPLDAPFAIM
jgi:hypothetical protein